MNRPLLILFLFFLFIGNFACDTNIQVLKPKHLAINIQPFADFPIEITKSVATQIKKISPYITIQPKIPLPASAYYAPRNRFRADQIISFLKDINPQGTITIGLTNKDISTTKGDIKDWGIMGLGYRPGNACVVSSFRLQKQNLNEQFYKVCIHELGHTAGLDHCPEKTCFMRDAEGGNPIYEEKDFCEKCRNILIRKGWNLNDSTSK